MRFPALRLYLDADELVIDGFAGGGGASTGIGMALGRSPDIAINHDREALAMHNANHPETHHVKANIREVDFAAECHGRRVGVAWFSPDCTFHSKARGGKPFRDRNRARRIRGLAWEVVRCAVAVRPRLLFVENVEEFQDWCPLDDEGRPIASKRGKSFLRWVARLRNRGYLVEWRVLRASAFGAPTSRKRLFIIARCDGQPIVWPQPTHGPALVTKVRTAAECIDFSLPVQSIFLTAAEAKAWGRTNGQPAPKRPLAIPTLRRVARGVYRFVIDAADPFIIPVRHQGDDRVHSVREPLRTIAASDRDLALVVPTLIQMGYGEREGQAPRSLDLHAPLGTIVGGGGKHGLVAAFLAKHNGWHEATGQRVAQPIDTVTTVDQVDQKALVTSHLLKLYGTCEDGAVVDGPLPTITASGNHIAEVRAFLVKFYGSKKDGRALRLPLDTITTKDRFGLVVVTIAGEEYVIVDIGMRMLTPRELFLCQGFPADYQIQRGIDVETGASVLFSKRVQTRLVGNSVPPHVSAALVGANCAPRLEAID